MPQIEIEIISFCFNWRTFSKALTVRGCDFSHLSGGYLNILLKCRENVNIGVKALNEK